VGEGPWVSQGKVKGSSWPILPSPNRVPLSGQSQSAGTEPEPRPRRLCGLVREGGGSLVILLRSVKKKLPYLSGDVEEPAMRAWQLEGFGGPERLRLTDRPNAPLAPGEVRVRVAWVGINPVDRSVVSGRFSFIPLPFTPGAEIVGTIEEGGNASARFDTGRPVAILPTLSCGRCRYCQRGEESACLANTHMDSSPHIIGVSRPGGWAEFVDVPSRNAVPLPRNLPLRDAVGFPVTATTAHHMLRRARAVVGEWVLVMGASGGVGTMAVQIARALGALVISVTGEDAHVPRLRDLGANHVINRAREDVVARVREITEGIGADVVIDPLGAATLSLSLSCLAPLGRLVSCGILTGTRAEIDMLRHYSRQLEYLGSTTGSRVDLEIPLRLASEGKIRTELFQEIPFESIPQGVQKLGERGRLGKLAARVGG